MTNSEMSLGDAIKSFLNKSKLKQGVQSQQIAEVWEQLMGKTIARYTDSLQLVNHTLFVTTHVAPLRQELLYQQEQLIQRLNEVLGENSVQKIVVR
jgi:predicted nucleic acid-binding Zn ribbon protein